MADDETNPPQANNRALPPAWALLTLQNVALLVFTGLALVIATIALHIVFFSSRMGNQHTVARLLELLVLSTVFCAFFAWINPANTQLLGRGIKHMLSVHRAAIGSFIIASTATVGMLFYIVLAAASSAELQHGLYLLAAIEFLLKLTAVSAIIVLITLRRAPVFVPARQTPEINNGAPPVVIDEPDDRGRLEFGSLAFAFGLVVIAGLVVPTEDLMRLTNFFLEATRK